jgi:DNA polymerase III alpha subunit
MYTKTKIEFYLPHVNYSVEYSFITDGKIILGLKTIKYISQELIDKILKERQKRLFKNLEDFTSRTNPTTTEIVILMEIGAIPSKNRHGYVLEYAKELFEKEYTNEYNEDEFSKYISHFLEKHHISHFDDEDFINDLVRVRNVELFYIEEKNDEKIEENALKYTENIDELKSMPYQDYLETTWWQNLRKIKLHESGNRCQLCNAKNTELHVHHKTYERRGNELLSDLIVLCKDCHAKFHDKLDE